jgi:hypothetical protein
MNGGIAGHWVFYSAGHTRGGIKSSQNKATFCDIVPGLPADCGGFVGLVNLGVVGFRWFCGVVNFVIALVLWVGDFGGCAGFAGCGGVLRSVIVGLWWFGWFRWFCSSCLFWLEE